MLASSASLWSVVPGAVLAGFCAGVLSALLGIGGAVVSTPMVRLLGGPPSKPWVRPFRRSSPVR
ncbi:MAG: hypothetical protein M5U19_16620 [Microthrixaceae bacterium]|nr:hypothetical protein [Microthrixaceae bacterium]